MSRLSTSEPNSAVAWLRRLFVFSDNAFQDFDQIMNVNFFEWLRNGVRQSVLLGVSDAIEQIGAPSDDEKLHPNIAELLPSDKGKAKSTRGGGRKRLGKSLKEMDQPATS